MVMVKAKPKLKAKPKSMMMPQIKKKAKKLGINCGKMKKNEIIHSIQQAEGFSPCFGTSNGQCTNTACCFIRDCLKTKV